MIKLRSARYCNLKLFLLYLVIYGHWIEPEIWNSRWLMAQYKWIYLVHMPLFVFLSGLFLRSGGDCLRQLKRLVPLYLLVQLAAVLFSGGRVQWHTPFWHLWYLLSCCFWIGGAWLWFRFGNGRGRWLILGISVLAGCLAGNLSWLDRTMSFSRTVVFFPYFWAGALCRGDIPWEKRRGWGMAALAAGAAGTYLFGDRIPVTFLYHAAPFGAVEHGALLRLGCYVLGGLLGFFLLTAVPDRRLPWSRAGADTMAIYLLHGPIVGVLRQVEQPDWCYPLLTAALIYVLYRILQWNSNLYGIISGERGDGNGRV